MAAQRDRQVARVWIDPRTPVPKSCSWTLHSLSTSPAHPDDASTTRSTRPSVGGSPRREWLHQSVCRTCTHVRPCPRKGKCPLWATCLLWATQENPPAAPPRLGSRMLVEKQVNSYKKMYSPVHIRTSRKRKVSGLQFGDFHERRSLDRKKAVRSVEARIVSGSRKSPQTKPAIIGSAAQTGCALL